IKSHDINDYFKKAQYKYNAKPATTDYYQDNVSLNLILKDYEQHFTNGNFLIPLGAIKCMDKLRTFTSGPFISLAADKGISHLELYEDLDDPEISYHGSVSMDVNFDALARYAKANDGSSMMLNSFNPEFQIATYIFNANYPTLLTEY